MTTPALDTPKPGNRIGAYELVARLGSGGMAEVWKATRELEGAGAKKIVALKLIAGHSEDKADYKRMFAREVRVSMKLSHANIAQVFDAGELDGRPYLVMEFINGLSLDQLLRRLDGELLPHTLVAYIIGQVLQGLAYAHDLQDDDGSVSIVHRDISPQNILVSVAGEVKVADFGIASNSAENTTGTVRGKLQYMPPEQLMGDSRHPTLDLFSVGAVLHELIDNRPFRAAVDYPRMLGMAVAGETPALQRPDVPRTLARLRERLLERDPGRRPPNARTALQYLYRWDGYRNASLELGELVRELRSRPVEEHEDHEEHEGGTWHDATARAEWVEAPTLAAPTAIDPSDRESQLATEVPTHEPVATRDYVVQVLPTERAPRVLVGEIVSPPLPQNAPTTSAAPPSVAPAQTTRSKRESTVLAALILLASIAMVLMIAMFRFEWWRSDPEERAAALPIEETTSTALAESAPPEPVVEPPPAIPTSTPAPTHEPAPAPDAQPEPDLPPGPKKPPKPAKPDDRVAVTMTAAPEYKLWVQLLIDGKKYTLDWPDPTAVGKLEPRTHAIKYRQSENGDWKLAGKIRIPDRPCRLTLKGGKVSID
jgi:serine/threonine protein kinase